VPFYGVVIVCLDDPEVQKSLPGISRRLRTYGQVAQADLVARNIVLNRGDGGPSVRFEVVERRAPLGSIHMTVLGQHNVLNALAAVAVGRELEVPFPKIVEALAAFQGVARRFELKGEVNGIRVIDDYGHHPTEIAAVLSTIKEAYGTRCIVGFQPHRYTRTRDLSDAFGRCFHQADLLFLLPVYAASEAPIPGVDSQLILEAARGAGHKAVELVDTLAELVDTLASRARPGDVVVTLGAGDITKCGDEIVERLGGRP
jgi:UDP-N-acetylmuramate--alanine ligase